MEPIDLEELEQMADRINERAGYSNNLYRLKGDNPSLFDKDERYTDEGMRLNTMAQDFAEVVFRLTTKRGWSIREVEYILQRGIEDVALNYLLDIRDKNSG